MGQKITKQDLVRLQNNPDLGLDWLLLEEKYLVHDRWLKLRAKKFRMPDGKQVEPYYVFEYPAWVNIVALTKDNEIILTRQFRPGAGVACFELPSGMVEDADASPLKAAKRELLEETGFASKRIIETGITYANPANQTNSLYTYLALDATLVSDQALDTTEDISVYQLPFKDLLEIVMSGDILIQSLHITSLFFAEKYLNKNGISMF